jgi:hypothetical protein
MANPLKTFCDQLVAFMEDLSETYPEEKDLKTAATALGVMKKANPRMIHKVFMEEVHKEFAPHIRAEDEEYILRRAKEIINSSYSDMNYALWIFDKHWTTMSAANKDHVWNYVKTLVVLAERVPAA